MGATPAQAQVPLTPASSAGYASVESAKKSNSDIMALFESSSQSTVSNNLSSLSGLNLSMSSTPNLQAHPAHGGYNSSMNQMNNLGFGQNTAAQFAAASSFSSKSMASTPSAGTGDLFADLTAQVKAKPASSNPNFDFDFGSLNLGPSNPSQSTKSVWD
ncbi:hypothetical protein L596_003334 [Steinernema carpocapsae]|uniref:Uncharacterized protein n=1 Tax=Steinernema carpocapsae TaxID=34508 RepID=A0A4U8US87_STECR|nr:hypothetical protein L596_003334 [Steinernema carpocapsae]